MSRVGFWFGLGLAGVGEFLYGGFAERWGFFGTGVVLAICSELMLVTGWYARWPRRVRFSKRARG